MMNKTPVMLLLIAILASSALAALNNSVYAYGCAPGDANGNGVVDPGDKSLIIAYLEGSGDVLSECADVNSDGYINEDDVGCVNAYLYGDTDIWNSCIDLAVPAISVGSEDIIVGIYSGPAPQKLAAGARAAFGITLTNTGRNFFNGPVSARLVVGGEGRANQWDNVEIRPGEEQQLPVFEDYTLSKAGNLRVDAYVKVGGLEEVVVSQNYIIQQRGPGDVILVDQPQQIMEKSANVSTWVHLVLALIAVVAVIGVILVLYREKKRQRKRVKIITTDLSEALELDQLKKQRDEIEDMIKVAKVKYYKRALDEDTYKDIVTENQRKLIQIEARIEKVEKRVDKLEDNEAKKEPDLK